MRNLALCRAHAFRDHPAQAYDLDFLGLCGRRLLRRRATGESLALQVLVEITPRDAPAGSAARNLCQINAEFLGSTPIRR